MPACRSCGAPIEWAKWSDTGKPIPLDVGEVKNGNLAVVGERVHRYTDTDARLHRERRQSHFASCPDSDDWRRR